MEGCHGGSWRRWWLGSKAWLWQVFLDLDLGFLFCTALDLDLGFVLYAPWLVKCAGLYIAVRAMGGAVALITDVKIRTIGMGNMCVWGGERAAPIDSALRGRPA
jgi:hypothetical protein